MYDPKVHVGVAALLLQQREGVTEVLLMRRCADATHGANTWALPGGWIDWGQSPQEAASRELVEEVNVITNPEDSEFVGAVANTYEAEDMHVICVTVHFPTYDASKLTNMEPDKCDAVEWAPIAALADLPLFPPLESQARAMGWL